MATYSTLVYLENNDQYLMLLRNRKANDLNEGKWIGVGGRMEEGESPEDCACREVLEETGLTLTDYRFRGIVSFVQSDPSNKYGYTEYMYLFTATGFEGEMKECNEGELHWIPKADVPSLNLWEGDRVFLKLLDQETGFFSLKLIYDEDRLADSVVKVY